MANKRTIQTIRFDEEFWSEIKQWIARQGSGESFQALGHDLFEWLVRGEGRFARLVGAPKRYGKFFAELHDLLDSIPDDRGREMAMSHVRDALRSFAEIYTQYRANQGHGSGNIPKKSAK